MGSWSLSERPIPRESQGGECPWVISYKGINCRRAIPVGVEQPYCSSHMKTYRNLERTTLARVHEKAHSGEKLTPEEIRIKIVKDDEDRANDWAYEDSLADG